VSVPGVDGWEHVEQAKAALATRLGAVKAYRRGEVPGVEGLPGVMPGQFALLSLSRTRGARSLRNGRESRSDWLLTVDWVGMGEREARWVEKRAHEALEGARLTVSGVVSTPLIFEPGRAPRPDTGRVAGSSVYSYTL
jgi:hypothetical protein